MKLVILVPILAVLAAGSAFAGASSENKLDPKALQGPDDQGSYSSDPGVDRSGSPGPSGPSDVNTKTQQQGTIAGSSSSTGASSGTAGAGCIDWKQCLRRGKHQRQQHHGQKDRQ